MAVTESTFKAAFPEFATTATAIVNRCIAVAELHVSEGVFGDAYDSAVEYLTAHFITLDPLGEPTAHVSGQANIVGANVFAKERVIRGTSRYQNAYESIRASVVIPILIA